MSRLVVSLALAMLVAGARPAVARGQETGGSFGGSDDDWGGGGSSFDESPSSDHDYGGGGSSFDESPSFDHDYGGGGSSFDESPSRARSSGSSPSYDPWPMSSGPSGPSPWDLARVDRGAPEPHAADRALVAWHPAPMWPYGIVWASIVALAMFLPNRDLIRRALRRGPAPDRDTSAVFARTRRAGGRGAPRAGRDALATVRRVSIGLDSLARPILQRELATLAASARVTERAGRAAAANDVVALVRSHARSVKWLHHETDRLPPNDARARLARIAQDLRARYRIETVGSISGISDVAPRADEGAGMIVVSIVAGATSELPSIDRVEHWPDVAGALASAFPVDELVGLEIVWSPSQDGDRLSSYELEVLYPELTRLADAGDVGASRCSSCRALRPRELPACPRCGSPAIDA